VRHGRVRADDFGNDGDDPSRCVADAEEAALALGEDVEPDGVAVEPGHEPLELA
jgi:hypothetical protein